MRLDVKMVRCNRGANRVVSPSRPPSSLACWQCRLSPANAGFQFRNATRCGRPPTGNSRRLSRSTQPVPTMKTASSCKARMAACGPAKLRFPARAMQHTRPHKLGYKANNVLNGTGADAFRPLRRLCPHARSPRRDARTRAALPCTNPASDVCGRLASVYSVSVGTPLTSGSAAAALGNRGSAD